MERNFDRVINRKNTNSVKYDFAAENGRPEGLLPLWVADMDFQSPPAVTEKLEAVSRFGIFGYSEGKDDYYQAVHHWYKDRFGWEVKKEWLLKTPGVVFAIAMAVRALTEEGDGVMIQQPVYYPFGNVIRDNNRQVVNSPLVLENGKYHMDLEDFEEKLTSQNVKLFILCSPHNPVGRVWSREELEQVGNLCIKHNVYIVSDEIHGDFIYDGYKHWVFADISPEFAVNSITCTAPSKTFNLAGLQVSNIFIPDREIRKKVYREIKKTGYGGLNLMGLTACQAAYEGGGRWLSELKTYLQGNLEYLKDYLESTLPQIKLIEPEGTYLVWLDLRQLGLDREQQEKLIVERAGLWLDSGSMFGSEGEGFERINIACPRKTLEQALNRLAQAL